MDLFLRVRAKSELVQNEINNSLNHINSTNMLLSVDENEAQNEVDKSLRDIAKFNNNIELENREYRRNK